MSMIFMNVGRYSESYTFIFNLRRRAGGRRLNRGFAYGNSPTRYTSVVKPRHLAQRPPDGPLRL